MAGYTIEGDCLDAMAELVRAHVMVDSIVTDCPYGIGFLGKKWDHPDNISFRSDVWRCCYEMLPPGGYVLTFSAPRKYHLVATAIEDAGFEIRDQISWVYGSGFAKSLDVSKSIDRLDRGMRAWGGGDTESPNYRLYEGMGGNGYRTTLGRFNTRANKAAAREFARNNSKVRDPVKIVAPLSPEAARWVGWGTSLKPAQEPIVVARKPIEGNHARNVVKHGVGGLNIDGCRVPGENPSIARRDFARRSGISPGHPGEHAPDKIVNRISPERYCSDHPGEELGRRPANFLHDGSDEITNLLGHAATFFYSAKASKNERATSNHPTVKPIDLMRWLVRLVTPPGGMVLDPFAGSGTTGEAAELEGFDYLLIEREPEYVRDIKRRLQKYEVVEAAD